MVEKRTRRTRRRKHRSVSGKKKRPLPDNNRKINDIQPINREHEELISWFQTVKFRKKLIGGVDELHLWRKLEELNGLYEAAIRAERTRYDALLQENKSFSNPLRNKYGQESEENEVQR